jgi:hypothetical protein
MVMKEIKDRYDQHVLDYVQFNTEQIEWFEEVEKKRIIEHSEWLEQYLKDFPLKI